MPKGTMWKFDVLSLGLIAAGAAAILFRRSWVRSFIRQQEVIFGLRVVQANERRIAIVPVTIGVVLILLGIAVWAGW